LIVEIKIMNNLVASSQILTGLDLNCRIASFMDISLNTIGWIASFMVKDRYGEPEGGSEWEPIKILLEGDRDSNKTNTASNTRLRLTTQVGQVHAATEVLLDIGTNK
jgi:hypothetical protein